MSRKNKKSKKEKKDTKKKKDVKLVQWPLEENVSHLSKITPHKFATKCKFFKSMDKFKILIPPNVMEDMSCIISLSGRDEIGWMGLVDETEYGFLLTEVFVPKQDVHGSETEISETGLVELTEELLERENGIDVLNKMRLWGHTHPFGGTSPSSQDKTQMNNFLKDVEDFFIGAIATKSKIEFTIYSHSHSIVIYDAPWRVLHSGSKDTVAFWKDIIHENVGATSFTRKPAGKKGVTTATAPITPAGVRYFGGKKEYWDGKEWVTYEKWIEERGYDPDGGHNYDPVGMYGGLY